MTNGGALGLARLAGWWPTTWGRRALGRLRPNSLRAQLALALVVAAAVPLVIAAVLLTMSAAGEAVEAALAEQSTLAGTVAAYIDDYDDVYEAGVVSVAMQPDLLTMSPEARAKLLDDIRATLPDLAALSVNSATGAQLAMSGYGGLPNVADLPVFQEIRRTNRTAQLVNISPVRRAPVLVLGTPIREADGAFAGVVIGIIFPERLGTLLAHARATSGAEVYVVDDRDRMVAHSRLTPSEALADLADTPAVTALRTDPGGVGSARYRTAGNTQLVGYARIDDLSWGVFVERPEASVLAGVWRRAWITLGVLLLAIGLAVAAGAAAARWLASPLATLARAASRLAVGDMTAPLPNSSIREVARLARAFDELRRHLAIRTAELAQIHQDLEARVAARTREWQAANAELQHELAERRRAEAALARLGRQHALLLDAVDAGICGLDPAGALTFVNPAAARLLGYTVAELVGWPFHAVVHPAEPADAGATGRCALAAALHQGCRAQESEATFTRRDGTPCPVEYTCTPILEDAALRGLLITFNDITPRLEAERQRHLLAQSEKLRALGQLASGVAHDLNQNLALIVGHSDIARRTLDAGRSDPEALSSALDVIGKAALDGAETVKRLLTFSRPRPVGPAERVELGRLLHDTAQLTAPRWRDAAQAEGRPIDLHVEADDGLVVQGWPESLREVFTNLVFNAVDALPHGGVIRIVARREADAILVDVSDNGTGIPTDLQAQIFEPFFTTKGEHGTGLGLAMAFGIVERHGGQIGVESAPGAGTTFQLRLPAAPPIPTAAAPAEPPAGAVALRILAVDDQPALTQMVAALLAPLGHRVCTATSGEEALEHLRAEPHDLVISDVGMGAGMNGWELAAAVREEWPNLPVVLATGWGAAIEAEEARAAGVAAVLAKPYRLSDVQGVIRMVTQPPATRRCA